jgi:hypothetical protein
MRSLRTLVLVLALLYVIYPTFAQQTSTPPISPVGDTQALTIITQSLAAMGAISTPTVMTLAEGTATFPDGTTKPVRMETIGNDRVRHDLGDNEFTFVSNKGTGYLILQGQKLRLRSWITAYQRPEHLPALSMMSDYQNPSVQVRYIGLENVNGNPAHHLRLSVLPVDNTPSEIEDMISEFHVWIDQTSLLVVETRHFDFSPEAIQNRTPVDIFFSDYRQSNGTTIPFHMSRRVANQIQCEIQFSTISLAATVNASDFQ